jgi:hypothetical protein
MDKKNWENRKGRKILEAGIDINTSQPMLGVLFFPLSPPSRKGATHKNQKSIAPKLASQGRASTLCQVLESQLSQVKLSQEKFWQHNSTNKSEIPFSLSLQLFYRKILNDTCPHAQIINF